MSRIHPLATLVGAHSTALVLACSLASASAAATSPTLDGETLDRIAPLAFIVQDGSACNPDGRGTINFSASGNASGPYPGTFAETGTVTLGPRPAAPAGVVSSAPVTSFSSNFTIESGLTTITGTATLGAAADMLQFGDFDLRNQGECLLDLSTANRFAVGVEYQASIATATPDSRAMANARNMVSQVESCYTDLQDYSLCQTAAQLGDTGLPIGSQPGEVEVTAATYQSYTIVGHSVSGDNFTITHNQDGTVVRTCSPEGLGDCAGDGSWPSALSDAGVGVLAGGAGPFTDASRLVDGGFRSFATPLTCSSSELSVPQNGILVLPEPSCTRHAISVTTLDPPAHGTLSEGTYTPAPGYLGFDHFSYTARDQVLDSAVATVTILVAGVTRAVATDESVSTGTDATNADPVVTAVTSPNAGTVALSELPVSGTPPAGYVVFGQEIDIVAPAATAADPLQITFRIAAGSGIDPAQLTVLRNGEAVPHCESPPVPDPTCMVSPVQTAADGDVLVTVLTTHASRWLLAIPSASLTSAFAAPIDGGGILNKAKAGRVIPVKLALSVGTRTVQFGDVRLASLTALETCGALTGDTVEIYSAGRANTGTAFRFDAELGQWVYNLSSAGFAPGKCYRGTVTFDGAVTAGFYVTAIA
jgi:hypothetical protein